MKKLIAAVMLMVCQLAFASGEDLVNCRWKDGREMDSRDCATFRRVAAEDKAKEDAYKKMESEYHEQFQLKQAERAAEKAKQQAIIEEGNQKRVAEMARQEAENKRARDEWERKEAKEEVARKRKCGKDYNTLRIGMTLDHLEQCVGAIYMTKTVGKGGVVATYRTMFDWVHVQNGRVISYTERTDN